MRMLVKGGWLVVLFFMGITPSFSQGLFESSLSDSHENLVSNSLSLGGFIRSAVYIGITNIQLL